VSDILDIYPNPVNSSGEVNLSIFSKTNQSADIIILNMEGKVLFNKPANLAEGANSLNYSVKGLAAGTYFLRLKGKNWHSSTQKFIKIND